VCFRIVWGIVGTRYARFASFRYTPVQAWRYVSDLVRGSAARYTGHNPAGSWAIYGLLALGLATGVSGWLRYDEIGGDAFEDVHAVLANAWLGLVALHVAAVIVTSVLHRENLPRTMVTGYKSATPDDAVPGARPVVGAGLLLATVALVSGWIGWGGAVGGKEPGSAATAQSEMAARQRKDDD
jgi:cytochrome b